MVFFSHLSATAAAGLVAAVWEGLLLATSIAVVLTLLPGLTAAARSIIWSAVMGIAVLLPFAHFSGRTMAVDVAPKQLHLDERLSVALVCMWAVVSLVRALQLISSARYLRRVARHAEPLEVEPDVAALLEHKRRVALCVSGEVDRPSVVGFFSPKILLPAGLLAKLSGAELQQIVLHEMEHLRRGDDWTNLLQKISLVVFPLNPVLVWIERRLCLERELACDDQVLRMTNARKAYAACLANLAEHSIVRRGVSLALGAWERQPELVKRVHRILSRSRKEMGRGQVAVAVSVMLCGLMAGADALAHSPELVSFVPVARASTEARYMPDAVAQQITGGHLALAKAVMPEPREVAFAGMKHRRRRATRMMTTSMTFQRSVAVRERMQRAPRTTVMLVGWSEEEALPMMQTLGFSYAAVPVRNGWLVLQL